MGILLAAAALVAFAEALPPPGSCRCVPPAPCWAAVPWATLNASIGGRLVVTQNELAPCVADINSPACDAALTSTDDEFWLSAQPGGYLHTGQFGTWNITYKLPAYSVLAESEADIQAAVVFASTYNLRLVVKNTGHDWYARSSAHGALQIWTHLRNNISFVDNWMPDPPPGDSEYSAPAPLPAVVLQSGAQFNKLYAAAEAAGRFAMGGTCDSVGAAGCWPGGCYGTMSRLYGSAASNMLQARVVLANGSLVVANADVNPDLFWALRGGGPGLGGVITELVGRTHAPPRWMQLSSVSISTDNLTAFAQALEPTFQYVRAIVLAPRWSGGYIGFNRQRVGGGYTVSMSFKGFETTIADGNALLQPLLDWLAAQPAGAYEHSVSWNTWNATLTPNPPFPWYEVHPDREISTALAGSLGRYPLVSQTADAGQLAALAQTFATLTDQMPDIPGFPFGIDIEKGQGGASDSAVALFKETSQNPVLLNTIGVMLVMVNVPSLPQLPPSARLLQAQWPRLQQYLFKEKTSPLWQTCETGAGGDEAAAAACYGTLQSETIPALQATIATLNATLWAAFPNADAQGAPYSGGYIHETDYYDPQWQASQWGDANYARLRAVKAAYDPQGLFTCHHCVGSEDWSEDGNCRV